MKILKKISLVYTLQIFAVILLFGYAVGSPLNKTEKTSTDENMPLEINKQSRADVDNDSVFTINALEMYRGKSR